MSVALTFTLTYRREPDLEAVEVDKAWLEGACQKRHLKHDIVIERGEEKKRLHMHGYVIVPASSVNPLWPQFGKWRKYKGFCILERLTLRSEAFKRFKRYMKKQQEPVSPVVLEASPNNSPGKTPDFKHFKNDETGEPEVYDDYPSDYEEEVKELDWGQSHTINDLREALRNLKNRVEELESKKV